MRWIAIQITELVLVYRGILLPGEISSLSTMGIECRAVTSIALIIMSVSSHDSSEASGIHIHYTEFAKFFVVVLYWLAFTPFWDDKTPISTIKCRV